jgi:hypothetical protein
MKYTTEFTTDGGNTWQPYTDLVFGCDTEHEFDDNNDADVFVWMENERLGEDGYEFRVAEVVEA